MRGRCVIVTAYINGTIEEAYQPMPGDVILCADGGYDIARAAGLSPALVIGDCDSGGEIPDALLCRVPQEKDDTDTMLCVRHAIAEGFRSILLLGGIGGRLDHTIANIQSLAYAHVRGIEAEMRDANERVFLIQNGEAAVPRMEGWSLSVFSYSDRCEGVYESGVQYPLDGVQLTQDFPLGVSNKITEETAHVAVRSGLLLVVLSRLR